MLLHGAWFVSSSTWNVVQKLQSFTFMKFHVLGTFIFSSQFHEYIILTNSQSYKYWKIKSSKNRFAKFLLNIQPSVAKKCPRSTCTAPKLYRETLFPPPPRPPPPQAENLVLQIIQWKKTSPRKSTNIKRTLDILRTTLEASVETGTAVVVGGAWVELKLDFTSRLPRF